MKKRIMTLMAGMLLLLTACGQTGSNSASTMLPVAAVRSAAQAIAPTEDKVQEDVDSLPAEEDTEEAEPAGGEDTPKLANSAEAPSGKTEEAPSAPAETAPPAAPEDTPAPAPTPAPAQKPAEKQGEKPAPTPEPAPTPKPIASGNIYSIAEAIQVGNEYARAQYGVTIDTSMTAANSSFFPGTADSVAWLAENGGQAALTAAVKGNVDATFACLAAMDGAETVSAYARFNCTVRYDAASDEYIVVVLYG
jgi:outer membrane biosynthesis protein TonB